MSKLTPDEYLLLEFNSLPIFEYGSNDNLLYEGDGEIELVPSVQKYGLLLPKTGYFYIPLNTNKLENIKTGFNLGFWLNSVSLQDTLLNGSSYSAHMPLVSIGRSYDSGLEYEMDQGLLCVSEKCMFNGYNQLIINIVEPSGSRYEFSSELYETGVFNHFLLSINTESDYIKFYINGVETVLTLGQGGNIPYLIGTSGSHNLYINDSIIGEKIGYKKNSGIIDDLFICQFNIDEDYKMAKIISDGFSSYLEENSGNILDYIFDAKINFLQKTNISPAVTAIDSLRGDVIAGTQDGMILKGDSGYWNKKFSLTNESGLEDIEISYAYQAGSGSSSTSESLDGKIEAGQGLVLIKNGIIIG